MSEGPSSGVNESKNKRKSDITPDEGPSLETSIFPLSFQVVREPLHFVYHYVRQAQVLAEYNHMEQLIFTQYMHTNAR